MAVSATSADRLSELRLLAPGARSALSGITLEGRTAIGKPIRPGSIVRPPPTRRTGRPAPVVTEFYRPGLSSCAWMKKKMLVGVSLATSAARVVGVPRSPARVGPLRFAGSDRKSRLGVWGSSQPATPGQLGREHFDDHLAAEGGLLSDKDATHASGT